MWRRKITVDDKAITDGVGITLKQSLFPCFLVTILFFLWGFAYGLLDVLNSHFQAELNITASMASGLSAAYFGAYFLCPLTLSGWILRRYGFRVTFMIGGVKASFGGFCGSMLVVGAGLSTLETGADSFLSICGPPRYSEIRLNLAQVDTKQGLKNVQWVYLGIACFVALLIVLFYLAPMPEVTDADMGLQEQDISNAETKPFRKQYSLFLGVWSQFCYVGAQVAVANYFMNFCQESGYSPAMSSNLLAIGQGVYAFNRFVASGLMTFGIKPRYILAVCLVLCFVFGLAATLADGQTSVAMLILVLAFESACFATIFSLALRGLGSHTKRGGSMLVAAISGGAAIPPMTGAVATHTGNFHYAMAIPTAFYVLAWNTVSRKLLDGHLETDLNVNATHGAVEKTTQLELERRDSKGRFETAETVAA
ncbi:hypothetical protein BBP40_002498 [Aspergillus hancockii]|nr:hypothetical protein BBP40_002498 [Aspergillus hancockii]